MKTIRNHMKTRHLLISDDPARLNRELIHRFLSEHSYWARGVSPEMVDRSLDHSLCFGRLSSGTTGWFCAGRDRFCDVRVVGGCLRRRGQTRAGFRQKACGRGARASPVAGLAAVYARDEGCARALCPVRLQAAGTTRTFYGNPFGKQLQLWRLKWPLNPK